MNQITIAGHLGADPEVRFTSSGKKVTTLRVAARARRSGKDETIWWKVTIWGEEFDKIIPYFKKGSPIIVVGELNKPEIFTDREGRPQVSMSITAQNIMFSPFGRPENSQNAGESAETNAHSPVTHLGTQSHGSPHEPVQVAQEVAHGQGKVDPAFAEDEIPF
jgi:single-strand DNA-binding protein